MQRYALSTNVLFIDPTTINVQRAKGGGGEGKAEGMRENEKNKDGRSESPPRQSRNRFLCAVIAMSAVARLLMRRYAFRSREVDSLVFDARTISSFSSRRVSYSDSHAQYNFSSAKHFHVDLESRLIGYNAV